MKQSANDYPLDNYSTDEQVVGTWTDGRAVYRKVLPNILHLDNSSKVISAAHNIADIDFVIRADGFGSNGHACPDAYADSFYYILGADRTNLSMNRLNPVGWAGEYVTIILYYVKTS